MNVLHATIATEWAGVAAHLYNLLPKLRERGVNVFFISFGKSLLCERLIDKGIPIQVIERKRKLDFGAVRQLVRHLNKNSIDIIHLHGYVAIIYGCIASFFCKEIKRVVTLHQPSQNFGEIRDIRFRYTLIFTYTLVNLLRARFIAVSKAVQETYLKNYNFDRRNMRVIYNGIDLTTERVNPLKTAYKERVGIPADYTVVSIIGRLEKVKGHVYFIEAAKKILSQYEPILFLIMGDGSERSRLEALVKKLNIEENVKFLGFQKDVFRHLAITDILVMASLFEGIPYTLLEAMGLGLGIIATNTGGLKEVINSYKEGILIEAGSSEAICGAVLELVNNDDLTQRLRKNAKKRVAQVFGAEKMAKETHALYRKMLFS